MSRLALAACCLLAFGGCTAEQLRDNQRGWREAECDKILSTPQRERCLREARGSSEESKKP